MMDCNGKYTNNKSPFNTLLNDDELENLFTTELTESGLVYRNRRYSPQKTLELFVTQFINGNQSCQNIVLKESIKTCSEKNYLCSIDTGAYCKARKRLPDKMMSNLVKKVGEHIANSKPAADWKGFKIKLVDGTILSMPGTVENQQEHPQPRIQKPGIGFPLLRIVAIISLATGSIVDYTHAPYIGKGHGETSLFHRMIPNLEEQDLVLADRLYPNYFVVAALCQQNISFIMKSHIGRKIDFRKGKRPGKNDQIVVWKKPKKPEWMSEEKYQLLPDELSIRQVKEGEKTLATNLLDAKEYRKNEMFKVYHLRWGIETDFRNIKQTMQLDILKCKTPAMIRKEIAACFIAYNLICLCMTKSAINFAVPRRTLSFKIALCAIQACQAILTIEPNGNNCRLNEALIYIIAVKKVGNRPGRREPRAIKRRPKPYSQLNVPREMARKRLCYA